MTPQSQCAPHKHSCRRCAAPAQASARHLAIRLGRITASQSATEPDGPSPPSGRRGALPLTLTMQARPCKRRGGNRGLVSARRAGLRAAPANNRTQTLLCQPETWGDKRGVRPVKAKGETTPRRGRATAEWSSQHQHRTQRPGRSHQRRQREERTVSRQRK